MSRSLPIWWVWLLCALAPAGVVAQDDYDDVVLADNPVAYYRFEETEGDVLADSSGNGLDSVSLTNVELGQAGQVGSSVSFPGNASIEVAATLNMADPKGEGPGDFSLEVLANAAVILPVSSRRSRRR